MVWPSANVRDEPRLGLAPRNRAHPQSFEDRSNAHCEHGDWGLGQGKSKRKGTGLVLTCFLVFVGSGGFFLFTEVYMCSSSPRHSRTCACLYAHTNTHKHACLSPPAHSLVHIHTRMHAHSVATASAIHDICVNDKSHIC